MVQVWMDIGQGHEGHQMLCYIDLCSAFYKMELWYLSNIADDTPWQGMSLLQHLADRY